MNQFEKRKAKAEQAIKEKRDKTRESNEENLINSPLINEVAPISSENSSTNDELTHTGYDITLSPNGRTFEAIIFKYNPSTRQVRIEEILPIQRQVALMYDNQKHALKTLLKR